MLVHNGVHVDDLVGLIDRVEYAPIPDGVFMQAGKFGIDGFMTKIADVRGEPLGLLEQPLSGRFVDGVKIVRNGLSEGQPKPCHAELPP